MTRTLLVLATLLALLAPAAQAAMDDDRFLQAVEAYRGNGRIEIVIRLTSDLRYVRHTAQAGALLQIQLAPGPGAADAGAPGSNSLRVPPSVDVPLDGVTASVAGATPSLVLHFLVPTAVERVESNPDERSISVWIADFGLGEVPERAAAAPRPQPPRPGGAAPPPDIYVVTLAAGDTPPEPDRALARRAGDAGRAYRAVTHPDGRARYELRLGFFDTSLAAAEAMQALAERFPGAWIGTITPQERDAALAGTADVDLGKIVARPSDPALPASNVEALGRLMDDARRAAADGDLGRAAALYERVAAYPVQPLRRDAAEAQGVVREKGGQLAQAKAAYEAYLRDYPQGEGAERVQRRLQALLAASAPARAAPRVTLAGGPARAVGWDTFGSASQFYRYDVVQPGGGGLSTTRSWLGNGLDLNTRRRSLTTDLRLRASGSYDFDFSETGDDQARASVAYLELGSRSQSHLARLGRQTRGTGGILGRLDGLYYGYRPADWLRLNLAGGAPVSTTSDGLDGHRQVYALGADLGPFLGGVQLGAYGAEQTVDGLLDRRAVGLETRYASTAGSLFSLVDYDTHFGALNIATLNASVNLGDATALSLVADRRLSPLLSTSNALLGQSAATIEALQLAYSEEQLRQLALDRTAVTTSYTGGLSRVLSRRFRLSGDVTRTDIGATPASGGVAAMPASGPDWYYGAQLAASDLLQPDDVAILGLRLVDAESYRSVSGALSLRFRAFGGLSVTPRLRVDRRVPTGGDAQMIYAPGLRAVYAPRRSFQVELEASSDLYGESRDASTSELQTELYYVGYRYDF